MGRKNLLEHLLTPSDTPQTDAAAQRKSAGRAVGVIGAMSESIGSMESDLRAAREAIESGDLVVELSTDLIDPSFIADRIGEDAEMEDFVASIRDHGQRQPILVRPHPERAGRYQIAFGHRRYRALQKLGRPVKALVKPLTDTELVVAQGQENESRLSLSFIERATFAARLEERKFQRDVICSALNIDKTEVSRMISVATNLPDQLIGWIGAAPNTGRRRWMELAKAIGELEWEHVQAELLDACKDVGSSSDQRFDAVLRAATEYRKRREQRAEAEPSLRFRVEKRPGLIRIHFDETNLSPDVVQECLTRVREICTHFEAKA